MLMVRREWREGHDQVESFCRRQQRLETPLVAALGFPMLIRCSRQECLVAVFTLEEMDLRFGDVPEDAEAQPRAKAILVHRQATWDSLDKQLGYSCAKQAEEEAFPLRSERSNDLLAKLAESGAGMPQSCMLFLLCEKTVQAMNFHGRKLGPR